MQTRGSDLPHVPAYKTVNKLAPNLRTMGNIALHKVSVVQYLPDSDNLNLNEFVSADDNVVVAEFPAAREKLATISSRKIAFDDDEFDKGHDGLEDKNSLPTAEALNSFQTLTKFVPCNNHNSVCIQAIELYGLSEKNDEDDIPLALWVERENNKGTNVVDLQEWAAMTDFDNLNLNEFVSADDNVVVAESGANITTIKRHGGWKSSSVAEIHTSLLAESGANITTIKRHGGWKSSSVAEGYIEDCLKNKNKIARNILPSSSSTSSDARENLSVLPTPSDKIMCDYLPTPSCSEGTSNGSSNRWEYLMQLDHEPLYSYYRHDLQINWNYIRSRKSPAVSPNIRQMVSAFGFNGNQTK
ncbi:hypothetical protein QE152_g21697 [Popillia japonica]|uniref:Tyr recombinase domain-containing protein n=1 Tax=Popillia japonica TaxID=7064 RepID=A0AAW1KMP2_POPJA